MLKLATSNQLTAKASLKAFQIQKTAPDRDQPLWATWAKTAVSTLNTGAGIQPTIHLNGL